MELKEIREFWLANLVIHVQPTGKMAKLWEQRLF